MWRMPVLGSDPEILSEGPGSQSRWSPDGKVLYFQGWDARAGNAWAVSPENGTERQVTDLAGRRGRLGAGVATDGRQLYFTWREEPGDIWVMDVVQDQQ